MKILKSMNLLLLGSIIASEFAVTACDKESDDNDGTISLDGAYDQKAFLQNSIVRLDESGNFMYRVFGTPLDLADTT